MGIRRERVYSRITLHSCRSGAMDVRRNTEGMFMLYLIHFTLSLCVLTGIDVFRGKPVAWLVNVIAAGIGTWIFRFSARKASATGKG